MLWQTAWREVTLQVGLQAFHFYHSTFYIQQSLSDTRFYKRPDETKSEEIDNLFNVRPNMCEGVNILYSDRKKDCLLCKLTTGIVLIGTGFYLGYNGYRSKGYNRIGMIGIGLTIGNLGLYRLLEKEKYEER